MEAPVNADRDLNQSLGSAALATLFLLPLLVVVLLSAVLRRVFLRNILRIFLLLWSGLLARLPRILALILLNVVCHLKFSLYRLRGVTVECGAYLGCTKGLRGCAAFNGVGRSLDNQKAHDKAAFELGRQYRESLSWESVQL